MATGGLTRWFKEQWVDISRPKEGGGFEPCGRKDADEGKYPKCVPASRAAKMTEAEIKSAVSRKRRAESTERREGKKPINVKTKVEKKNVPTDLKLYAEVKAAAKRKFDVYPSAYANGWLVQEYKRRGGKYKSVAKGSVGLAKHVEHDQSTHGRRKTALPGVDWDEFKTPPDELRRLRAKRWPGDILDTEEDGVSVEASIDEVVEHYELIVGSGHENLDGDTVARTPDGDYIALHSEDGKVSVAKTYDYFDEVADDVDLTEMAEEIHRDWQRQAAQGVAYHGTSAKNLESIRRDGLETRRITRGLSNKGVGNAIYMHPDSYFVDSYADAGLGSTIEIDIPRLIKDGLLKVGQLGREVGFSEGEAVEALASDFEDYEYTSGVGEIDGADRDTIVIFEDIPPEYLSVNGEPLSKHAEHDQKTHGRRKTAGSSKGPASAEDFQSVLARAHIRAAMEERPKALSKWQGPETFDERLTRCYELSWKTLNEIGGGGEGHQLVHGSIHGPDSPVGRIPHAWVELADGTIFDPVLDLWFSPDEWERGFSAEAAVKYDFDEVGRQSLVSMNMGPWHDAPYGNDWYAERGSDA